MRHASVDCVPVARGSSCPLLWIHKLARGVQCEYPILEGECFMNFTSHLRAAQSVAAAAVMLACATGAQAADIYSAGHVTIPTLTNGPVTYSNVVVAVGTITSGPAGTSPLSSTDNYDSGSGQIFLPTVQLGTLTFYNAAITVASVASIKSVSGADSYNGTNLTISYVLVGNSFYRNAVVTVSSIVGVAGGMPAGAWDTYDLANGELTIPAVQVGNNVYTNVTIRVRGIVSVGTVQGTAQTITYTAPTGPYIPAGSSGVISASTTSGLPATFVVTTPQNCAVVATSAQLQSFYITYSGTSFGGWALLSGVPVGTNIFEIESVIGNVGGQPLGMLATTTIYTGLHPNIPYTIYQSPGNLAYDNIFYANGSPNMDAAGLGMQAGGSAEFNPYYNSGYKYANDALANQNPPWLDMQWYAAEVDGLVGLADGTCNVLAFQNGNYSAGAGYASATPVLLSIPIVILLP